MVRHCVNPFMKRKFFENARPALAEGRGQTKPGIGSLVFSYALGYLRWTQFIPMVAAWMGVLFLLGALALARFYFAVDDLDRESREAILMTPGVQEAFRKGAASFEFISDRYRLPGGDFDFGGFIREAWSLLALAGFLLSMLLGALGFHFRRRTFGQKIKILAWVSLGFAAALTGLLLSFGEHLTDGPVAAMAWGPMVVMIPFVLSGWGLWVSDRIAVIEELFGFRDPPPATPDHGG